MTALAGLVDPSGRLDLENTCTAMLVAQAAYGAGKPAVQAGPGFALGRRLHSASCLGEPATLQSNGGTVLAADLRLDNREELASALGLGRLGDAALLAAALERWGEEALGRIVGDFAFAWWDGRSRKLLLARDFSGQRPLHFSRSGAFFAFASMPRGLHSVLPRRPCAFAAARFLLGLHEPESASFFEGVERLPPGHLLAAGPGGTEVRRWWRPEGITLSLGSSAAYHEELREHLDRAVGAQLRGGEGRIGSHLSGGLDSSAVSATAAAQLGQGEQRLTAFTSVPRDPRPDAPGRVFDEWPLAAATAARYPNIDHVPIPTGSLSILDGLERNVTLWERPIPNLCNQAWVDAISAEASRRGLKLMLTGIMGNLSFSNGGSELLPELFGAGRLLRLAAAMREVKREGGGRWAGVALQTVGPFLPGPVWTLANRMRGLGGQSEVITFATPDAEAAAQPQRAEDWRGVDSYGRPPRSGRRARVAALGRIDPGNFNKGTLAGWALDIRDPSADRELFEFTLAVPTEEYAARGMNRALARRAFADRLPEKVRLEMRKGYQASDWPAALGAERERLRAEAEAIAASPAASAVVDTRKMLRIIDAWPGGGWSDPVIHGTYRLSLLRALAAGHFLRSGGVDVASASAGS